MANQPVLDDSHARDDAHSGLALPTVRKIGVSDLREALAKGVSDFWAMPSHLVFLSAIYPVAGLMLARLAVGYEIGRAHV